MISTAELANKKFTGLKLPQPYRGFLGEIPEDASMSIWGPPGSGKSTFALDLALVLADLQGKGIYCSSEEGPGPSLQNKIKRLKAEHDNLLVDDYEGFDNLKAKLDFSNSHFVVIDSISKSHIKVSDFQKFQEWCKAEGIISIFILHTTKDGTYKGPTEYIHDPDIEIRVYEDGTARTENKNRYLDTPREMEIQFERKDEREKADGERENPGKVDEGLLYGIPYIENPGEELRENRAVKPDEIYQMVTDMIINTIEEKGHLPWQMAWDDSGLSGGKTATNFVSGNAYRGINFFMLNFRQVLNEDGELIIEMIDFDNPYFLTFNQVDELGGKIKKDSRGHKVVYFTKLYKIEQDNPEIDFGTYDLDEMIEFVKANYDDIKRTGGRSAEDVARSRYLPILKYYNVFHASDIEGIDWGELPKNKNADKSTEFKIEVAKAIYENYPDAPEVKHVEPRAYYQPDIDFINMPPLERFDEEQFYHTTLFHEAVHSTGHKSRLGRNMMDGKGSHAYAKEELIAEMGAVYLCSESGILFRTIDNSAKYLQSWNKRLVGEMKDDKRFFFRAASRAQAAADYILDRDEDGVPAYRSDLEISESTETEDSTAAKDIPEYILGKETTVDFKADGSIQEKGHFAVMDVDDIIPSHNKDCTQNSDHKISKGQPRDRSLDALCSQPKFIAQNLNPTSITRGNLAFNGASSLIPDGQVIQGNGRGIALKIAKDEHPENYSKYKKYITENASDWGLSKSDVSKFDHPALVRVLDVSEDRAIELGNVVDTSQAKMSKIDQGKAYIRNLPKKKKQAIGNLINDSAGETIGEVINDVGLRILDQIEDVDRQGLVEDNALTSEGKEFLRSVFAGLVFDSDENKQALQHFMNLKHTQKAGLERSYGNIIPFIDTDADLTPTIQKAVEIAAQVQRTDGIDTVNDFMNQADAFEGANSDKFSKQEAQLAQFLLDAGTQKFIRNGFRMYQWKVNGKEDLFNPIEKASPKEAFNDAFVERVRINPSGEQVKLQSVNTFGTGEIIRDFYDTDKFEVVGRKDGKFIIKNTRTGKKESVDPEVKRFVPDRSETPTMELFRNNAEEALIYLGICEKLSVDGCNGDLEGAFLMCSNQAKDTLYIIPNSRAKKAKGLSDDPKADELFEQFHQYAADDTDYEIDWPDNESSTKIGTADVIFYASDKVMRKEDEKGKTNLYRHEFDSGKRPVKVMDDIAIIENVEWNERGILN